MPNHDWQKSTYCAEGEACLHVSGTWQKSSHCQEGDACLHVAVSGVAETVHLTESADPAHSILSTTPAAFGALLRVLRGDGRE
ncbi:DUF397 domain-containing protein [Streptomyces sp. NPDC127077]|uniref:DUF397 domain-containing protein n=1 Tax=Streptomyces sp. NPDC127077 TaxID=3347131 RepID=UPI003663A143